MTDLLQENGPAGRLASETIGWLTTALATTPEQLAADLPTTIRITPTRTRAW